MVRGHSAEGIKREAAIPFVTDALDDRDTACAINLSVAATRLFEVAAHLTPMLHDKAKTELPSFQDFVRLYREWIRSEHGMPGSPEARSEQTRLLLYAIIGAATIGEALKLFVRFRHTIYGVRGGTELRPFDNSLAVILHEPLRSGPEGLLSEIWPLSFILCQLEFLVGSSISGVCGRVRNADLLPAGTAGLLFPGPLEYNAAELALVLPKAQITRPIVPRASDIPAFLRVLMPTALSLKPHKATMTSLVTSMIRSDKLFDRRLPADVVQIAGRLGVSEVTLRRRLRSEGETFREIKEDVLDELAKDWLVNSRLPIDAIAERLGFSDRFAFRRAFRRRNDVSPASYRRATLD